MRDNHRVDSKDINLKQKAFFYVPALYEADITK
jgi:hypothetical protein